MNFIIALQAEAKPLIDALKLKKVSGSLPFPTFQNDNHQLVVSGIGKIASAGATGFSLGKSHAQDHPFPFLNIGIAGHGSLGVGTLFIADRIFSENHSSIYYPPQLVDSEIIRSPLQTCELPNRDYQEKKGYDMEAHSFYTTASKCVTRELVQVIKIVSDNLHQPLDTFNPKVVSKLVETNLPTILGLVRSLEKLANEISPDRETLAFRRDALHSQNFTETQTHLLVQLLNHSKSFDIEEAKILQSLKNENSAKSALKALAHLIEPYRILS
ncbi:MAG: hypothetical protein P8N49_00655 [Opitutales bacterium]|nr:hypothetical protein [Opitutales bacterium]